MEGFLGFLVVILSLFLWANTNRDVRIDQIDAAAKVCEPHGGTKWIAGNVLQQIARIDTEAECRDGTKIVTEVRRVR